jgi:hypothetical protein
MEIMSSSHPRPPVPWLGHPGDNPDIDTNAYAGNAVTSPELAYQEKMGPMNADGTRRKETGKRSSSGGGADAAKRAKIGAGDVSTAGQAVAGEDPERRRLISVMICQALTCVQSRITGIAARPWQVRGRRGGD